MQIKTLHLRATASLIDMIQSKGVRPSHVLVWRLILTNQNLNVNQPTSSRLNTMVNTIVCVFANDNLMPPEDRSPTADSINIVQKPILDEFSRATCDVHGSYTSHSLTHIHTLNPIPFSHPPPSPPLQPQSPLSLRTEQRCLSRSLSSPPPQPPLAISAAITMGTAALWERATSWPK